MAKVRKNEAPRPVPVGLIAGILAGVLAIGLIAGLSYYRHLERPCTPTGLHEHAAFSVYIHNESVVWSGPRWNYGAGGAGSLAGHVHQPNSHTVHMESGTDCITLKSFFGTTLQTVVTTKELTLDEVDHGGRSVIDGEGGELRFFLGTPIDWSLEQNRSYVPASEVSWAEVTDLPQHQPRDGEYMLVTFGNEDDGAIAWQQLSIPIQNQSE